MLLNLAGFVLNFGGLAMVVRAFGISNRLERARWASQLNLQFFSPEYRAMRQALASQDPAQIMVLIQTEPAEFVEFLNFFETVAYLRNHGQIEDPDLATIFRSYPGEFRKHPYLSAYLQDPLKPYKELAMLVRRMQNRPIRCLFVYGTLRPDAPHREIGADVQRLRRLGTGSVRGHKLELGEYPGVVLDSRTGVTIKGEVLELPADDAKLLARLDAYEGYQPDAPQTSLFLRQPVSVVMDSGQQRECWIYTYNRTV
jgi:gamma-glutamylcyclotransferase (GGCT)/AIG2-like uncharacterized protein YtfP